MEARHKKGEWSCTTKASGVQSVVADLISERPTLYVDSLATRRQPASGPGITLVKELDRVCLLAFTVTDLNLASIAAVSGDGIVVHAGLLSRNDHVPQGEQFIADVRRTMYSFSPEFSLSLKQSWRFIQEI